MRKFLVLLLAASLLFITACTKVPDRGIVTAHDYSPRWMQMVCASYNSKGLCTVYMPRWHPEKWHILVDPDTNTEGGEAWVTYREDVFETFPIGSVWINPNPSEG